MGDAGLILLDTQAIVWLEAADLRLGARARGVIDRALSDGELAIAAVALADFHKDPADRLIVATALDEGARLVTSDAKILAWLGPLARIEARL